MKPVPRYLGILMLIAMAALAAAGYFNIRKNVDTLRVISQDNILWSATQMEVELLKFQFSLAVLASEQSEEALEEMRERFDILWSRVSMSGSGRVGEVLERYDAEFGAIDELEAFLHEIDPVVASIAADDRDSVHEIIVAANAFQKALRLYTLRVMRGDSAMSAQVRDRIETTAQFTAVITLAAVILSVLSLLLIFRENRRQTQIAELNRRSAEAAEQSSRAKSRFLSMMSHELRNPLNALLGPLALLGQSGLSDRQTRLVDQASQSGQSMLNMLSSMLDYGEVQDGQIRISAEPFRLAALSEAVREALARQGAQAMTVTVRPGSPKVIEGDIDRLRQIFVHLGEFALEARDPATVALDFDYEQNRLIGEIGFADDAEDVGWKLDLLMGVGEIAPDQVSADALRPLISRGLISAAGGELDVVERPDGRRVIRATIPAAPVPFEQICVHLETRSAALAAIYKAALRSERVVFTGPESGAPVDVVLVDATSVGSDPLMRDLRARFPEALFVSLGQPQSPGYFDDIVEAPNDMNRLRSSVLGRLAS